MTPQDASSTEGLLELLDSRADTREMMSSNVNLAHACLLLRTADEEQIRKELELGVAQQTPGARIISACIDAELLRMRGDFDGALAMALELARANRFHTVAALYLRHLFRIERLRALVQPRPTARTEAFAHPRIETTLPPPSSFTQVDSPFSDESSLPPAPSIAARPETDSVQNADLQARGADEPAPERDSGILSRPSPAPVVGLPGADAPEGEPDAALSVVDEELGALPSSGPVEIAPPDALAEPVTPCRTPVIAPSAPADPGLASPVPRAAAPADFPAPWHKIASSDAALALVVYDGAPDVDSGLSLAKPQIDLPSLLRTAFEPSTRALEILGLAPLRHAAFECEAATVHFWEEGDRRALAVLAQNTETAAMAARCARAFEEVGGPT